MSQFQRGLVDKVQVFLNGFTHSEYLDFIENLICDLPDTYKDRFYLTQGNTWVNNQLLLAESRLYQVTLSDFGQHYVVNVIVIPNTELTHLAQFCLAKAASCVFDRINKYYDVWTPDCYRTSLRRLMPSSFNKPAKIDPKLFN
ncbi:MAG TPA: hypothetical protein PKC44_08910 [Agitococcus sp.]|nr:hypothetical protein [Agitococcus sp.]